MGPVRGTDGLEKGLRANPVIRRIYLMLAHQVVQMGAVDVTVLKVRREGSS